MYHPSGVSTPADSTDGLAFESLIHSNESGCRLIVWEGCCYFIWILVNEASSIYPLVIVCKMIKISIPDSKIHGANMGPTWALSDPDGPHVGPMNLAIRDYECRCSISVRLLKDKVLLFWQIVAFNIGCLHIFLDVYCVLHWFLIHLPLDKNDRHFLAEDNFKCIFLNENDRILIQISLKFVSKSPIDNKPPLVMVMAWHWTDNKPLPEPKMLPQFTDEYVRH